jgi:predicted nucleic acid-binding protein
VRKRKLLVDTDILISYLNRRRYRYYLESEDWQVYYSVVTRKELLAKQGLSDRERQAILLILRRYRQINISQNIALRYAELREQYSRLEREDALIAASALVRRMPLLTRNHRHFRIVARLTLLPLSSPFPREEN